MSCIEEVFDALLDDQERKLHHISDHDSRIRLVSTVLSTFEVCEGVSLYSSPEQCVIVLYCLFITYLV